ncbi:MAG: SDR family NAD(P)-dependent oxidoreductase, partial [Geminicoccales bacterium]
MNQIDLNDRIAIVTGGSGGIGMATADRMLRSGAKVVIWERSRELVDATRRALPEITGIIVDVTDEAGVQRATQQTVDRFGRIDILVNAAGVTNPRTLVVDYPYELWQRMIDVNLNGTFLCCREVVPHMQKRNYGRIVNLGSVSGKEGNPFSSGYSAAKAAVHALTKSLAKE